MKSSLKYQGAFYTLLIGSSLSLESMGLDASPLIFPKGFGPSARASDSRMDIGISCEVVIAVT